MEAVNLAKSKLARAQGRVTKALATTPDDKINWSPSPTCRTPVQQVAHCANAVSGLNRLFKGDQFPFSDTVEFDAAMRAQERAVTSRKEALALLNEACAAYEIYLDGLTSEQLASTVTLPFGAFPMCEVILFPADHMSGHASQMDYMQTIYGDRDWHMA